LAEWHRLGRLTRVSQLYHSIILVLALRCTSYSHRNRPVWTEKYLTVSRNRKRVGGIIVVLADMSMIDGGVDD
jgi:hypothetical protein